MAERAMKGQVAATPNRPGSTEEPSGANGARSGPAIRRACIAEALWELQRVFDEPGCFGDCSAVDAAETLASELVGPWRDDEVLGRLRKFTAAEAAGAVRDAARHLGYVRRKLAARFGVTATPSHPLAVPTGKGEDR